MKLHSIAFRAPVLVPGKLGRHTNAYAEADKLAIELDERWVRLTAGETTVFVPYHVVLDFQAAPEQTPTKATRGKKS